MTKTAVSLVVDNISKCYELYARPHQRLLSYFFKTAKRKKTDFWALRAVSFTLERGETLGIVGRNGSGKSTLLQIICGTLSASEGNVQLNGRVAALLELGAGFNVEFTGRENILLNAAIYGLTREEISSRLDDIVAFADIGEFIDQPVQHYSSGMFVRLAFAVIAHVDADILIIDEALAVGDALFAQKCMRYLEDFKRQGSIIFVSHDSGAITRLCDKAIWLDRGVMQLLGDANSVSEAYLEHLYSIQQEVDGKAAAEQLDEIEPSQAVVEWFDARSDLLDATHLRNDVQIFRFEPEGANFGTGKVVVRDVFFIDERQRRLAWVVGGKEVSLCVDFIATEILTDIIVGFLVKNRLGQILFGENNCLFLTTIIQIDKSKLYRATFNFILPYLPEGEYVVSVGIASGSQQEHIQHCWRHDALVFTSTASHVVHGLMGIPVRSCTILPVSSSLASTHAIPPPSAPKADNL